MSSSTPFPSFPYHPDPRATGVIVESDADCLACSQFRGFIYRGPVYSGHEEELSDGLCPWCIADGTAAARFGAHFTDVGWGVPDDVPPSVIEAIATRTPGFMGWQSERWLYHCADGAAFLGPAGRRELEAYPDALEMLRHEGEGFGWSAAEVEEFLDGLDKDGDHTAYVFACRHCGSHLAYSDSA